MRTLPIPCCLALLGVVLGCLSTALAAPTNWPFTPIAASAWRLLVLADSPSDKARAALLAAEGVGLPQRDSGGTPLAWATPRDDGHGTITLTAAPWRTHYLLTHLYNPVIYREPLTMRVTAASPPTLTICGVVRRGTTDKDVTTFVVQSHELRNGANRMVLAVPGAVTAVRVEITQPGDLRFFAPLPTALDPTKHVGTWPSRTITNGLVTARLALPDPVKGYHRGSRFESAGIITNLSYAGHTYFLEDAPPHQPLNSNACVGPCEEFFEAIAFADAKLGEPFIKIGVGLFERPVQETHTWYVPYWRLKTLPWKSEPIGKRGMQFTQTVSKIRGWGYRYVKRLELVPGKPQLRIAHRFTNTGAQPITAEQYAHNWTLLDKQPVDSGYHLTFPFTPATAKDVAKTAKFTGKSVDVLSKDGTHMVLKPKADDFDGWSAQDVTHNAVLITHDRTKARLRITGDFPLSSAVVFFNADAVCFEPFYKFTVQPGETAEWTRIYDFEVAE